ncbi:MAG: MFS transporter [Candidatus Nanopelagicales bacterium]
MSSPVASAPKRSGGEWLDSWDPENAETWDSRLAWKTLWITTFNLTLAFVTWFLVSALAPQLNYIGFDLSKGQLYWLVAMPGLAGGLLRIVWMFLPPILGTRKLVWMSTALLLIPLIGWGMVVNNPSTSYTVLLMLAFMAGVGGGVFSGFMPSTSYFFPKSKQGTALGLQAGIGNFGVSLVQFVSPWVVGIGLFGTSLGLFGQSQEFVNPDKGIQAQVWYNHAGWFWVPWVIIGVILAFTLLKSVPVQARGVKEQLDIFSNKHTWLMTWLYILTFGTFSGLAAQFGLLMKQPLRHAVRRRRGQPAGLCLPGCPGRISCPHPGRTRRRQVRRCQSHAGRGAGHRVLGPVHVLHADSDERRRVPHVPLGHARDLLLHRRR